ncbi:hypothetical protein FJZ22_02940 [Candidatus Pacearchaeota archaeon]|nr:hypothetical protein [Candidatus Pacearchaeota archaeon]
MATKITYCPQFLNRGVLCTTRQIEENSLLLSIYQFYNLYHSRNKGSKHPRIRISGEELLVVASLNETMHEGNGTFEIIGKEKIIETEATVVRIDQRIIIAIPHTYLKHEDVDLIFGESENVDIYLANQRENVGRTIERFFYAAGAEQGWHFFNAKEQIMQAIGISHSSYNAWKESLSIKEAWEYNLKLTRPIPKEKEKKNYKNFLEKKFNPVLPSNFKLINKRKD